MRCSVMLDSGAFSAWRLGEPIDLTAYITFIKGAAHLLDSYVCLDSIPGLLGTMNRGQAEIEKSAAASYKNQQIMRDAGLSPVPVFHQGERLEWLERYLTDGEPYIGLSPYLRSSQRQIAGWLDDCFSRIYAGSVGSLVKTHGFGVTGHRLILSYPWYSVDSTTWVMAPAHGTVVFPLFGIDELPDLSRVPKQVYLGETGGARFSVEGLRPRELDWLHAFLAQCGVTLSEARSSRESRIRVVVTYLKLLQAYKTSRPTFVNRASFTNPTRGTALLKEPEFRILFASQLSRAPRNHQLIELGVNNRLLSYHDVRGMRDPLGALEKYVLNGFMGRGPGIFAPRQMRWDSLTYRDYRRGALVRRLGVE